MQMLSIGDLGIDLGRRRVTLRSQEVRLSPTEFRLLCQLGAHPGAIHTYRMLLQSVWGDGHADESEYLHVYMGRLRRKLEADPAHPAFLLTVPGIGYMLREP